MRTEGLGFSGRMIEMGGTRGQLGEGGRGSGNEGTQTAVVWCGVMATGFCTEAGAEHWEWPPPLGQQRDQRVRLIELF